MIRNSAFVFIVLFSLCSQAQVIPNGGFETWVGTPQFTLDPEFWQTNNNQVQLSTSQDSLPYEGQWAMRVEPIQIGVGEEGYARIEIPTTVIPPSLDFHVKYERTATCALGVNVDFYNGESWVYGEAWFADSLASEWAPVSMPLDQIEPIMTHVEIRVWSVIGDFAAGDGWISVDAMSFNGVTGLDDLHAPALSIYPNPTSDVLYVSDLPANTACTIYDSAGKLLSADTYQSGINVSDFASGNYFLEIKTGQGVLRRTGFVVE